MEVKTCRRCNKMFQYIGGKPICPRCKKKEEELFQVVKAYLRENVGATMEEVSEATGATLGMIQGFLREGRLEVTPDSPIALTCEQCGAKIRTGRFCDKCKNHLSNSLQDAANSMKPTVTKEAKEKERMRFLDSLNK
ncbi:MAG: flagellar protein [Cellulosilyticaceae bacterium]